MRHLFKQVIYDLKSQPVLGLVSVIGTALAIMLIMVVVMMQQARVVPYAPESNRERILYTNGLALSSDDKRMTSSSRNSLWVLKEIFDSLSTVERVSYYTPFFTTMEASTGTVAPFMVDSRVADENYWRIFDHTFIDGHPYTDADGAGENRPVVIAESVSRRLFGTEKSVGRELLYHQWPMRVCGVVKDVSPIMGASYSQMWGPVPIDEADRGKNLDVPGRYFGSYDAIVLLRDKADAGEARREIASRWATFDSRIGDEGWIRLSKGPYDQEEFSLNPGINNEPDVKAHRRLYYATYLILLLVPAINLASMTQSRLRRRRHEIGVRRAFGATRSSVLTGILAENLVVTLAGGIIGLIFSLVFAWGGVDVIFDVWRSWNSPSTPIGVSATLLFRWPVFGLALLFSFILNLLSAGIPAWHASRVNPVEAINNNEK